MQSHHTTLTKPTTFSSSHSFLLPVPRTSLHAGISRRLHVTNLWLSSTRSASCPQKSRCRRGLPLLWHAKNWIACDPASYIISNRPIVCANRWISQSLGWRDVSLVQHTRRSGPAYRTGGKQEHKAWQDCVVKAHSRMKEDVGATNILRRRREGRGCQGGVAEGSDWTRHVSSQRWYGVVSTKLLTI
jgi:hypothetical protein